MQKDVICPNCNKTLFGRETDGGTLVIKHRDLYRIFEGGKVSGPCRGCGYTVTWEAKGK